MLNLYLNSLHVNKWAPLRHGVRNFVFSSGERLPALKSLTTTISDFDATDYLSSQLRARKLAAGNSAFSGAILK